MSNSMDDARRKSMVSSINLHLRTLRRQAEGKVLTLKICIMFTVLCFSITTVWVLFSLPIVFYIVQPEMENNVRNMSAITNVTGNCSQNFVRVELANNSQCVPVCGEWKELPQNVVVMFQIFQSVLNTIHFIGTVLALVLCCYNHNVMFRFPSVLLVYYLLAPVIFDVLYVIRTAGSTSLLCYSSNLLENINHTTPFCSLLGTGNIYVHMISGFWWLFHTAVIFWNIWFPLHARHFDVSGYTKYVHIVVVVLALTLPVLPVGIAFGTGGFVTLSFTMSLSTCVAKNTIALFYSFVLPLCLVFPVGITLNILSIWKLLKKRLVSNQKSYFRAEMKLLCFFFYFSIATIFSLTLFVIGFRNIFRDLRLFFEYFSCEVYGRDPSNPCVLEVEHRRNQALIILSNSMLKFAPYITLIYIVPVKKARE